MLVGLLIVATAAAVVWHYWSAKDSPTLSFSQRRELAAGLVRRLTDERTAALAAKVNGLRAKDLLELLTAEDVGPIIQASRDNNTEVRTTCYVLLGRIGTSEAMERLKEVVNTTDPDRQDDEWDGALEALTAIEIWPAVRSRGAPDALFNLQKGKRWELAVMYLAMFRDERVLHLLLSRAKEENWGVQISAVQQLGSCPGEASERALQEAIGRGNPATVMAACRSLGKVGGKSSIPILIQAMTTAQEKVQNRHRGAECSRGLGTGAFFHHRTALHPRTDRVGEVVEGDRR